MQPERDPRKTYANAGVCDDLANRCASKARTTNAKGVRTKWYPSTVIDPRTEQTFAFGAEWAFIVDHLRNGIDVEVVDLETQPGKKGYVLKPIGSGGKIIYVKLQFGMKGVIGQSFHTSDRQRAAWEDE